MDQQSATETGVTEFAEGQVHWPIAMVRNVEDSVVVGTANEHREDGPMTSDAWNTMQSAGSAPDPSSPDPFYNPLRKFEKSNYAIRWAAQTAMTEAHDPSVPSIPSYFGISWPVSRDGQLQVPISHMLAIPTDSPVFSFDHMHVTAAPDVQAVPPWILQVTESTTDDEASNPAVQNPTPPAS